MKSMRTLRNQKGFTLLELVIVVVVLGIMAALATFTMGTIVSDSRTAAVLGVASSTSGALALAINTLKALPTGGAGGTFQTTVLGGMTATGKVSLSAYDGANNRFIVCSLAAVGGGPCTVGGTVAAPTGNTCGNVSQVFMQVVYTPATGALAFSGPFACSS